MELPDNNSRKKMIEEDEHAKKERRESIHTRGGSTNVQH